MVSRPARLITVLEAEVQRLKAENHVLVDKCILPLPDHTLS